MLRTVSTRSAPEAGSRDVRLDLFRGLALIFIFINHVPDNVMSWATNRYYGFSDAAEIFVFIAGYTAMIAYGKVMDRKGLAFASAKALRRGFQIYMAHVLTAVILMALAFAAFDWSGNALYVTETGYAPLLLDPASFMLGVATLAAKPVNLDVLPLYVVLLAVLPAILAGMTRSPNATLAVSAVVYFAARREGWNLQAFPEGEWVFNPFTWQFLFVIGGWLSRRGGAGGLVPARLEMAVSVAAAIYLVFSFWILLSWDYPAVEATVPAWVAWVLYPIDKASLDPARLIHFMALGWLTVRFVRRGSALEGTAASRVVILLGRNSLSVFCASVLLSFAAYVVFTEVGDPLPTQVLGNAAGIGLLIVIASTVQWLEQGARRGAPKIVQERPRDLPANDLRGKDAA